MNPFFFSSSSLLCNESIRAKKMKNLIKLGVKTEERTRERKRKIGESRLFKIVSSCQ